MVKIYEIPTPELDKISKVEKDTQNIGAFLDWLQEKHEVHLPKSILDLLADYFDIDQKGAEKERKAILVALRKNQKEVINQGINNVK